MICLGLNIEKKKEVIREELVKYGDVDRIYVFYGDKEAPEIGFEGYETIYTEYKETEMYRTFYPLLGQPYKGQNIPAITDKSLLIVDEFMVTKNRSDLKYNCTKHYLRVSNRHIVFNHFPLIDAENDFMILADMDKPDRFKGRSFDNSVLQELDIKGVRRTPEISCVSIETTSTDAEKYEKKKESLFENIGMKDPNTIPRNLLLVAGDAKKRAVEEGKFYVARNGRIKKPCVYTYENAVPADEYYILDMHYQIKVFERFIRDAGVKSLIYMKTDLSVDNVYYDQVRIWHDTMEDFYETADIH